MPVNEYAAVGGWEETGKVIRLRPSRDFLVRQAVLNTAAKEYPVLFELFGSVAAVQALGIWAGQGSWSGAIVRGSVLLEWAKLRRMYDAG